MQSAGLVFIILAMYASIGPLSAAAIGQPPAPDRLRTESLRDPMGLTERQPRLSWINRDRRIGACQTAYRVLVASSEHALDDGIGDLWDSGKVASKAQPFTIYDGSPLSSGQRAWWAVRIWDQNGEVGPWSEPASFSIGLLEPDDWQAQWIADPTPVDEFGPANNGYHSQLADRPDSEKWVTIDLGAATEIDAVVLWPARPYDWVRDEPGFLFPERLVIEVSNKPDFSEIQTVVDRTDASIPSPGVEPVRLAFNAVRTRYVRVRATSLRMRNEGEYGIALAEIEVESNGRNIALGAPASASDSIETDDWSVQHLTDGDTVSHGQTGTDPLVPPRMRKAFLATSARTVKQATVYVSALGLYELTVNGHQVDRRRLAPEWTDYTRRVQFQTFDVTDALAEGENVLAAQLADGWYSGRLGLTFSVPGTPVRGIYGRKPKFLLQLEIEYDDGTTQQIVTDASWKSSLGGPWRVADLLDGVVYDGQQEQPGWTGRAYDDSSWSPVDVVPDPGVTLVGQYNDPIRVTMHRPAVSVSEPTPGVFVYDFGQNLAGWARLTVDAPTGRQITLRHAEVLNQDGTLYTDNLRSASQIDRYISPGPGTHVFEPRFTYHGFRYLELSGLEHPLPLSNVEVCAVHSDPSISGSFETSDDLLNQLCSNILWTQRANMMSVPTDCPQRDERLGWTGDILAFAPTACFNMDMAAFLNKWLQDMRDAQTVEGRYPDYAPFPFDDSKRPVGVPAWGDAGVFVAWDHYRFYGDKRLLETHYDSARRWVDWIHSQNPNHIWQNARHNDYGDWLNGDRLRLEGWPRRGAGMPKEAFATAFYARSAQILSWMARELGRTDDRKRYEQLADNIRQAFIKSYVSDDGTITGDTQGGYAIALNFDLLPEDIQPLAVERMLKCFDRYDGCISTGFHSTVCLMRELSTRGHVDEAYRLALNRKMPSWGYAIDHGATTIWERWDGYVEGRGYQNPGMNSFSHYAIGSVGEWLYSTILGIKPLAPGFARIAIHPMPGGGLTWAGGEYESARGTIAVQWHVEGNRFQLTVLVPADASAVVRVPTGNPDSVLIMGSDTPADAPGVTACGTVLGGVEFEVQAGRYVFEADVE
ncbi:MAG: family 78 glycoside hydrolase catalytic domain [Planctomycetes bacterium]|nr:family 78 glycoside hydrolase catalytic domain [Planctomycetota bacterium]